MYSDRMISVVVPLYNESATVRDLHERLVETLRSLSEPFEIIFVDDGSVDGTAECAASLTPLTLISLQRNYGQTGAIDVGLHAAEGDRIVLIDADLQNDPKDISVLLSALERECDVVVGFRPERRDHWTRLLFSRIANACARRLLGLRVRDFGCGLKAYRRPFIEGVRLWGDSQVFLAAIARERGARVCEVPVRWSPRQSGSSKVRIARMARGAFDLVGIAFFVKYFSNPLRFFGGVGATSIFIAFLAFGTAIILRLGGILHFTETPLPLVGSLFALLGVLLFMMGLLAEMLLRMHYADPSRSPYLVKAIQRNP